MSEEWIKVRAEIERLVTDATKTRRTTTQEKIAAAGGLSDQNYVSKVLRYGNNSNGPSITHFLRLLKGLGVLKASEFLVLVEKRAEGGSPSDPTLTLVDPEERLKRELGQGLLELLRRAGLSPTSRRPRGRPRKRRP